MINRNIAPAVKEISKINLVKPQKHILSNGVNLYSFRSDNSPVIKLDVIFNAGIEYESEKMQAVFANALLKEAPKGMTPDETSEYFDYYGSFPEGFTGNDSAGLRLYVPKRYLSEVLPVFADLFKNPSLPENEFEILKSKHTESLRNNLKKTKYVAMKGLNSELFGSGHPRGNMAMPEDVESIRLNGIKDFVNKNYQLQNCFMQISGMADDESIELCNRYFGKTADKKSIVKKPGHEIIESSEKFRFFDMDNAVQSSIYVGKNFGKITEDELIDLSILNTVLGGYFGSRLMKNIREDKGYTYGIGSFLSEYNDCTVLKITTDVGINVTQNAIDEIFKEIDTLSKKRIHFSELNLVRNFMLGDMLSSFDGVFQTSAIWEKLISTGKSSSFINKQITRVKNITASELQDLSVRFFQNSGFHTVVAGKI